MQEDKHKFLINGEEISFEIGNMAKAANDREQELKQQRINLAEDHMSTQPDPDDYDMSSKRDRKKFERKSKKWTKEAEDLFGSQWRDYFTE